jgi:hemolysin III
VSKEHHQQSRREEIANSITHGIGAGLALAALSLLVTFSSLKGDVWRIVSFSIYGTTLFLLYITSTLYHGFRSPRVKHIFNILDHSAIFLLIAGSYTPFTLVTMRGPWGWSIFGVIWGLAIFGITFKALFIHRFPLLETLFYVLMGWLIIVAIIPLIKTFPIFALVWLAIGGLCYTLGLIFYNWEKLPYNHSIWHLFVLAGSICHFFCMLFYVLPM